MPSQAFEQTMLRISQEFYEVNSSLIVFGGTMRYPEENVCFLDLEHFI